MRIEEREPFESEKRQKGQGFLGPLKRPDGRVSTELSVGVNIDGREMEIPSIVPTLSPEELNYLLSSGSPAWTTPIGESILQKAVAHAKRRLGVGLSPWRIEAENKGQLSQYLPLMHYAAKRQENDPERHGVLSIPVRNPEHASEKVSESLWNSLQRWVEGKPTAGWIKSEIGPAQDQFHQGDPNKFVDFTRRRWAPLTSEGATNDPDGKNAYWAPNVRSIMKQHVSPAEWQDLEKFNFVRALINKKTV